jgi:hypothetical protein
MRLSAASAAGVGTLALLVSVLAPAVAPAAVQQLDYISYVSVSKQAPASRQTAVVSRCPAGTVVLGGGVSHSGGGVDDEVATTAPFDGRDRDRRPDDGWIGEVNLGSTGLTITAYAICGPFGGINYPSRAKTVRARTRGRIFVACPEGHTLVGGGVRTVGTSTRTVVAETTRDLTQFPNRWRGAVNNGLRKGTTFTAYAICMRADVSGVWADVGSSAGSGQTITESDFCGLQHAVSGGGSITGGLQGELASLRPQDSGDGDSVPDDGWELWTNNETSEDLDRRLLIQCFP